MRKVISHSFISAILVVVIVSIKFSDNVMSQNLVYPEDTIDSYLLPTRFSSNGGAVYSMHHSRIGHWFHALKEGTAIYGVGCILPLELPDDGDAYIWLYKPENGAFVSIDSVNICNAISNTSVVAPCFIGFHGLTTGYDTMPIFEFYFDTAYPVDDTIFGICWGTSRLSEGNPYVGGEEGEIFRFQVHLIDTDIDSSFLDFYFTGYESNLHSESSPLFKGVFPIIDTSNRHRNERLSTCGSISKTNVEYTDERIHTIHWTDTVGHCLYQVAVGPVDSPYSEYEVFETTDTSLNYNGLVYGERRAFRVRAMCCVDTYTIWRPWSDTLQFERPFYKLSLFSNDYALGSVYGYGRFEQNSTVFFSAYPKTGCAFDKWNDGDTANPRSITLECDTSFTAIFSRLPNNDTGSLSVIEPCFTNKNIELEVSPNPANDEVRIKSSVCILSVEILDMQGRKIMSNLLKSSSGRLVLSSLPTGVFMMRVLTEQGIAYTKLIHK